MSPRRPTHDRPVFNFNITIEAPDPEDFVQHEPDDDYDEVEYEHDPADDLDDEDDDEDDDYDDE